MNSISDLDKLKFFDNINTNSNLPYNQPRVSSPKKTTIRSPMSKKDPKEISTIIKEKNKCEMVKTKLNEKRQEILDIKEEIKKLFTKSNNKESELKNYIANLNSKLLNVDVPYDDRIDEMHKSIMTMISDIQEKVKMEINFTKKEMEREVVNKFMEAEQKQHKLMTEKIEEQKKVFERMNNTRVEIEKIRKHFEHTNSQCENLTKENENLRINLQSLEEDNESLEKKLALLRKEYIQLAKEHKFLFKNEEVENPFNINFEDEEDDLRANDKELSASVSGNKKINSSMRGGRMSFDLEEHEKGHDLFKKEPTATFNSQHLTAKNTNLRKESEDVYINRNQNEPYSSPDTLIEVLRENIKQVKTEYKILHKNHIEELRQRNEAQQLIQKCIEDLKLEITKTVKDINNFTKAGFSLTVSRKFDEQLAAKQNHLNNLENKIKILTFVYDNGFQNTKMKKNKLFSSKNKNKFY